MSNANNTDINYGRATIPWDRASNVWRLPNGEVTTNKQKARNMAKRMDRILSGKHKNDKAV